MLRVKPTPLKQQRRRAWPAARARLQSSSDGSSDTELNGLAVRPISSPLAVRAVTIVSLMANMPSATRNSPGEKLAWLARRGGREFFMPVFTRIA